MKVRSSVSFKDEDERLLFQFLEHRGGLVVFEEIPQSLRRALPSLFLDGFIEMSGRYHVVQFSSKGREAVRCDRTLPDQSANNWPTQARVARMLNGDGTHKNPRVLVARLIEREILKTNGKTGHNCRIDPESLMDYLERIGRSPDL